MTFFFLLNAMIRYCALFYLLSRDWECFYILFILHWQVKCYFPFQETKSVSLFHQNAIKMQFLLWHPSPHLHLCMHPTLSLSGHLHFLKGGIPHTGARVGLEELLLFVFSLYSYSFFKIMLQGLRYFFKYGKTV